MNAASGRSNSRDWKWLNNAGAKFEKHWFVVLVGIVVACCTVAISIVRFIDDKQIETLKAGHELQIKNEKAAQDAKIKELEVAGLQKQKDLESKFADKQKELQEKMQSIIVRVGDGSVLDVKKLILDEVSNMTIPLQSEYHREGRFYASRRDGFWTQSLTTSSSLDHDLYRSSSNPVLNAVLAGLQNIPDAKTYLWRGNSGVIETQGLKYLKSPFVFVSVQQATTSETKKRISEFWSSYGSSAILAMLLNVSGKEIKSLTESLSDEDLVQFIYLFEFCKKQIISLQEPSLVYKTPKVQKLGNVFYSRFVGEIGERAEESIKGFSIFEELIIVLANDRLYTIRTMIPSLEGTPRGDSQAKVNEWLGQFLILAK